MSQDAAICDTCGATVGRRAPVFHRCADCHERDHACAKIARRGIVRPGEVPLSKLVIVSRPVEAGERSTVWPEHRIFIFDDEATARAFMGKDARFRMATYERTAIRRREK